jgi:acetyl-CoA acetyltransferase family protein
MLIVRKLRASTGRESMAEVYIIAAVRTPIGAGKPETGALFPVAPMDLAAHVLREAVRRSGADPAKVQDVILGIVTPVDDQGANLARLAVLKAGFPTHVPAVSLNRMCGSSQQAIHFASQAILAGDMDLVIAGGVEMMSHQPLGRDYPKSWPADFPFRLVHQGISAEMMADLWKLNREELDNFAFRSHERAGAAIQSGALSAQILPVSITKDDGAVVKVERDQGVRIPPNREKMAALPPAFKPDGVVTAGNSSQVSDGAAAVVLASEAYIRQTGVTPLARVVARVVVGSDPVLMLDAPIPATRIVLERAGLKLDQIDLIEINEAFASVVLAWQKETHTNLDLVNPDGGAIAHGHPLGATGAVLMTKLVDGLRRRNGRYGLQTMCIGHGMATATVIERM